MSNALSPAQPTSLLGQFLLLLRTATAERMVLPDLDGTEIDECILLESHLVGTPAPLFAGQKPPLL
jgi:hypothetical protein